MLKLYEISHFLAFLCPALTFYIFCLPDHLGKIIQFWPVREPEVEFEAILCCRAGSLEELGPELAGVEKISLREANSSQAAL